MVKKKNHPISYKALNGQLSKMKKTLEKIKKDVTNEDKKDIDLQLKAIGMFLRTCHNGRMTHIYHAKMTIGKCATND